LVHFIAAAAGARRQAEAEPTESGPIEVKEVAEVRPEPYTLPAGFEWCDVDIASEVEASLVQKYELCVVRTLPCIKGV
jgi:hypothetical protein